jgi:prophage regulatory protein
MSKEAKPRRVLRRQDVEKVTGLKRSRLGELIRLGRFPKAITAGRGGARLWLEDEIAQWQQERIAERDAKE